MNPIRRYARRMAIPRNNNGEQPSNSTGADTVAAMSTEPIPSNARAITILSTTVTLSTLPEGKVLSPITQSHPVTPRPIMTIEARPFAISFTMPMVGREQPYGMSTSIMENLHTNPMIFVDNAANTYSPILVYGSTIGNHSRTIPPHMGMGFGSQEMPTFTVNFVMAMRQQMDESNHDMVNTLIQQMGTIFNPLIRNTNQSCQQLTTQMNQIDDFFGTPSTQVRPIIQPQIVRLVQSEWAVFEEIIVSQGQQVVP